MLSPRSLLLARQWNLLRSPEPWAIHKNAKRTMPQPIELKPDGVEQSGTERSTKEMRSKERRTGWQTNTE